MSLFHNYFSASLSFLQDQQFPQAVFWKNLFIWQYWASTSTVNPPTYAAFFALCYALPAYCLFVWQGILGKANKKVPIYRMLRVQIWSIIIFLTVGVLLYNFSYAQGVAYFSSRLLILMVIIITVLWILLVIFLQWRVIPHEREAHLEKERFFRYLPKKKERIKN